MGKQDDFTHWILPHLSHRVNENGKRQWKISPLGEILDCTLTKNQQRNLKTLLENKGLRGQQDCKCQAKSQNLDT